MRFLTFDNLAAYIDGKVLAPGVSRQVNNIVTRLSRIVPNCILLVCQKIHDEDFFIFKLQEKNVSGIIIENPSHRLIEKCTGLGICVIAVGSARMALYDCASIQRRKYRIPFIQIIGSSGKTTTKEMLASVLQEKIPIVKTIKNYNAPSEIAKTILKVTEQHKAAIFEVGMTTPDMMKLSSSMLRPDIAIVTSIHRAHLMRFGSMDNIIAAKAQMLNYLSRSGTLIINGEDKNCRKFLQEYYGYALTFGFSKKCDIWASDIYSHNGNTFFKAVTRGFSVNCSLKTFGKYNILNALAVILAGLVFGIRKKDIVSGLANFTPVKNRLEIINGINGSIIVNDNYNANPDSTQQLFEEIPSFAKGRSVILVLGDMENPSDNIRDYAKRVHFHIGREAAKIPFNHLIAIGKWAEEYVHGARSEGVPMTKLHYFRHPGSAKAHLKKLIIPNSVLIFKSSPYVKVRSLIPAIS